MRRAALLCLAALWFAPTASASTLLVQEPVDAGTNTEQNVQLMALVVKGILREREAPFTFVPSQAMTTAGGKASQVVTSWGTETHHATIHLAASLQVTPVNSAIYDPRTYLSGATWPSTPHLWMIYPASGAYTNNTASDTTGAADFYASGQAPGGCLYTTNGPWAWKNLYAAVKPAVLTTRVNGILTGSGAFVRTILAYGATAAGDGAVSGKYRAAVVNADSLILRYGQLVADSAVVWTLGRYPNDPATQVFCYAGASGILDIAAIKYSIAMLDSITAITNAGGRVFTSRTKTTKKHSLVVTAATLTGTDHTNASLTENGGTYVKGDSTDLVNVSAGLDSLTRLGLRYTALIDPESTSTTLGAAIIARLKQNPNVKFGLQPVSGTFTNSATRASAAGRCIDPVGISRRRTIWPSIPTTFTPSCTSDSGSVYCNVKNGFTILEALAPGRVDHVLAPAAWDWTPQEWTSNGAGPVNTVGKGMGQDSLVAAYASAGVRAILINPVAPGANVGTSWSAESGALTGGSAPAGWSPVQQQMTFRWGSAIYPGVKILGTRYEPASTSWSWQQAAHPGVAQEYLAGSETGKYYLVDAGVYYKHVFNVRTDVMAIPISFLGGPYATPWPQRPGYWQVKWLTHGFRAANSLLPRWADGSPKSLDEWVYAEDLEP